jgi:chaperonin GroES
MEKIKPLGDKVLVRAIVPVDEEISEGGLYVTNKYSTEPSKGIVLAVGLGKQLDDGRVVPLEVFPGEVIIFPKHSGTDVKFEGIDYKLLTESMILGVIEECT